MKRSRAPYTECRLYIDGVPQLDVGHFLKTPAGSAYLVQSMRQNKNRPYRRHLVCLRWPVDKIPPDSTVHPLHWYARKKRAMSLQAFQQAGAR